MNAEYDLAATTVPRTPVPAPPDLDMLGAINFSTLRAVLEDDGDIPLLVVSDDGRQIEFEPGRNREQAILGAERLATAAQQYADDLRRR